MQNIAFKNRLKKPIYGLILTLIILIGKEGSAQCIVNNQLIEEATIEIFADDQSPACYPLIVRVNGVNYNIASPGVREAIISCPPCSIPVQVNGDDTEGVGCDNSGSFSTDGGNLTLGLLSNTTLENDVSFTVKSMIKTAAPKPNPVLDVKPNLKECAGDTVSVTAINNNGFQNGTKFRWTAQYPNGPIIGLSGDTQTINFILDPNIAERTSVTFSARSYIPYGCNTRNYGNIVPYTRSHDFYPKMPEVTIIPQPPSCPSTDDGSIAILHTGLVQGMEYYYTIIRWVPGLACEGVPYLNYGIPGYCTSQFANASYTHTENSTNKEIIINKDSFLSGTPIGLNHGLYSIIIESKDSRDADIFDGSSKNEISCLLYEEFNIPLPDPLSLSANGSPSAPSCTGGNDGSASFAIANGIPNFSWKVVYNNNVFVKESAAAFSNRNFTVSGLEAGSYKIIVTDGCTGTESNELSFTVQNSNTTLTLDEIGTTHPTCIENVNKGNGSIQLEASTIPGLNYTFELSNSSKSEDNISEYIYTFDKLPSGTYSAKVKTSNGCEANLDNIELNEPTPLNANVQLTNFTCSNSNIGSRIRLYGVGKDSGEIKYNYVLVNNNDINVPVKTGSNIQTASVNVASNIEPGTYTLTVTDQCLPDAQIIFQNLTITKPAPISITTINDTKIACFDGTINQPVVINDGTAPFTLALTRNGVPVLGYNPFMLNSNRNPTLSSLGIGNYQVSVTDNCGVIAQQNFQVYSDATEALTAEITKLRYDNNNNGAIGTGDHHLTCPEADNGQLEVIINGGIRGAVGNEYNLTLLNQGGTPIPANISNSEILVDNRVRYMISGLSENIAYQIDVVDGNTSPEACVKRFSQDKLGNNLSLTAPQPLAIKIPDINTDFANLEVYNNELYVQCKGDNNGQYNAQISGGNRTYTLNFFKRIGGDWVLQDQRIGNNTGAATFTGLNAGNYRMEVVDQQNCAYTARTFVIREAVTPLLVDDISAKLYAHGANTTCYGDADGEITVTTSGGVGNYTYTLIGDNGIFMEVSKPANVHTFTGLPAITAQGDTISYTLELADAIQCTWNVSNGVSNLIKLNPPQPVAFEWSIISPTFPDYEIPCLGEQATVRVWSEGGHLPHYITINGITKPINEENGTVDFSLAEGIYDITMEDALNCTPLDQQIVLRQPDSHVAISQGAINYPVCIGAADGTIDVSAMGGIPTSIIGEEYSFLIKPIGQVDYDTDTLKGTSATFLRPANYFTSQDYYVMVVDAHGCADEILVTMPVNPNPLTLQYDELVSPSCYGGNDGYITVTASNYTLINGQSLRFILSGGHLGNAEIDTLASAATITFEQLEGTDLGGNIPYSVWVEDANLCVDTAYQYLDGLQLPSYDPLVINLQEAVRPSCYNGADGSLKLQVSGGVAPYQYSRNNVDYFDVPLDGIIYHTNLESGEYDYYLRDSNYKPEQPACLITATFEVPLGRFIELDGNLSHISCLGEADGEIELLRNVRNRNIGEAFEEDRFTQSWTYDNESSTPFSDLDVITNLEAGSYTVHASYHVDSLSCTTEKTFAILQPQNGPFRINELTTYQASCGNFSDGRAVINVAGGWPSVISYYSLNDSEWIPLTSNSFIVAGLASGTHKVEIAQSDFNCSDTRLFNIEAANLAIAVQDNLSPTCPMGSDGIIILTSESSMVEYALEDGDFQPNGIFTGLSAGLYRFVAQKQNDNSCISEILEVTMIDPIDCGEGPLTAMLASKERATCDTSNDGHAFILAVGGVPPYQYYWNGNEQPENDASQSLSGGSHFVVVIDAVNERDTVNFEIELLAPISVQSITTKATCTDSCNGTVQLLTSGGSGVYSIVWEDGFIGDNREGLCPGVYHYSITDNSSIDCITEGSILIEQYPELELSILESVPPTCPGGVDGYLKVEVDGGSGSYTISWSNGASTINMSAASGAYEVTVADNIIGCILTQNLVLPEALPITVTAENVIPPSCYGGNDGSVSLVIDHANTPLVIWDNGHIGLNRGGLSAGWYEYNIYDAKGCSITGSVEVQDRNELVVNEYIVSSPCSNGCNGSIDLAISGGVGPYAVRWNHGPRVSSIKNLCEGTYTYTITDRNNCQVTNSVSIVNPAPIQVMSSTIENPSCFGGSDGSIQIEAIGGTGRLNYLWSNQATSHSIFDLNAANYSVIISDEQGCQITHSISLIEPEPLLILQTEMVEPSCSGGSDGAIYPSPIGGTPPYQYFWQDGVTELNREGLLAGNYELTITDINQCEVTRFYSLEEPSALEIVNVQLQNPLCFGEENGSISLEVIGGIAPYSIDWQNGNTGNSSINLPAGNISVTVMDALGCSINTEFTLYDPELPVITGIEHITTICEGATVLYQPEGNWTAYNWTGPNGFESNSEFIEVGDEGIYSLTAWDVRGCPATIDFEIDQSESLLTADFLRISEAITYSPIVFVDISIPLPDRIEWLVADDRNIVVNSLTTTSMELVFTAAGDYEIGLRAFMDNCVSELHKVVTIEDGAGEQPSNGRTTNGRIEKALHIELYPNPSDDHIYLKITAPDRSPLVVSMLTNIDNAIIRKQKLEGQFDYLVRWDIPEAKSGIYNVILQHNDEVLSKRIVVK